MACTPTNRVPRDAINGLSCLSVGGFMFFHDMLPNSWKEKRLFRTAWDVGGGNPNGHSLRQRRVQKGLMKTCVALALGAIAGLPGPAGAFDQASLDQVMAKPYICVECDFTNLQLPPGANFGG